MRSGMFLVVSIVLLLGGCTGTIRTKPLNPGEELTGSFPGLVYYPVGQFYEMTATTITKDSKGNTTHWYASGTCVPVVQSRLVTRLDYEHPRLVYYDRGLFDNYTFNVTLSADGSLQSVGSQSAPDRGQTLSNLSAGALNGAKAGGFAAAAKEQPTNQKPACNDGPVVFQYKPVAQSATGLE